MLNVGGKDEMPRSVKMWRGKTDDTPIPPRVKVRVAKLANYTCQECGIRAVPGDADHVQAVINGGCNSEENLQWLCIPCHRRKTKADLAIKSRAAKRQKQMALAKPEPKMKFSKRFDGTVTKWNPDTGRYEPL